MERWKAIIEVDSYYEVSNLGRIRRARSGRRTWIGRIVKPYIRKDTGYMTVAIRGTGPKMRRLYVHILVAKYFVGPRPSGKETNHKDLDKSNNHWDNLEYITHLGNVRHALANGVSCVHPAYGEAHSNSKLTWRAVRKIRSLYQFGVYGCQRLATRFGVTPHLIHLVVTGNAWKEENRPVNA